MSIMNYLKRLVGNNKLLYRCYTTIRTAKIAAGGGTVENNGYARMHKDVQGENNLIRIGEHSNLNDVTIRIRGNNNIIIFQDRCYVGPGCSFWMEGNDIRISVGSRTTFTRNVHFCAQEDGSSIAVGEDCMFSNTIVVRTSDSHVIYDRETHDRINEAEDVIIGDHVWIAPGSKVMKGVNVGSGSIVGSNTMVLHDVPENVLVVGQPARVVKENIEWTREKLF